MRIDRFGALRTRSAFRSSNAQLAVLWFVAGLMAGYALALMVTG